MLARCLRYALNLISLISIVDTLCFQSCQAPSHQVYAPISGSYCSNSSDPEEAQYQPRGNCAYEVNGKVVIPHSTLSKLDYSKQGLATIGLERFGYLFIKRDGTILRAKYCDNGPDSFSQHLARYLDDNDKVGFINESGKIIIKAQFGFSGQFSGGHTEVCNDFTLRKDGEHQAIVSNRWGCIDEKGRLVIPMKYSLQDIVDKMKRLPITDSAPDAWGLSPEDQGL